MKTPAYLVGRNKSKVLGIFIIMFLTVTLGTCFLETNQSMAASIGGLKIKNIQDISFYPVVEEEEIIEKQGDVEAATQDKVEKLSEKYGFDWEKRDHILFTEGKEIVRGYSSQRGIDRYKVLNGEMPKPGEVLCDVKYARAHGIKPGDKWTIGGTDYEVSGIVLLPDMISPVVDDTGKLYDDENQGIAVINDEDFRRFGEEDKKSIYVGVIRGDKEEALKKMRADEDFLSFSESGDDPRIFASVKSQQTMNYIIMGFSVGILASIAVLLLLIAISEHIKSEEKNLGVLKALGYRKTELSLKYFTYVLIVGGPALLGYFAGHALAPYYYNLVFRSFSVPYENQGIQGLNMVLFVLSPAVIFAILAFLWAMFKVRKPALDMIQGKTRQGANKLVSRWNRRIRFPQYLKGVRGTLLFSRLVILIFVLFSGFALGVQIQFAYSTYNMTGNIKDYVLDEYRYEKDVRLADTKDMKEEKPGDGETTYYLQTARLKDKKGESHGVEVVVMDRDRDGLLNLKDEQGKAIRLSGKKGVVINRWMALKYGLDKGDKVTLTVSGENYRVEVTGISQSVYGSKLYVGRETGEKVFGVEQNLYNGYLTDKEVAYNKDQHLSITSKEEMGDSIDRSGETFGVLSVMLFICGLVVGVTMLALSLHSVMENNKEYMAFMEAMGYTKKECSYTALSGYRIVAVAGFLLSIPYTIMLSNIMFRMISVNSSIAYPTDINILSIIICLALTLVVVELILAYFRKRIGQTSLKEVMEG